MSKPKRAVYRALIGGYEQLREEAVAHDSDVPFICFTDDPTLTSETWQIIVQEPRLPHDLTRSARAIKILGHSVLDEYEETLWLDNTVALQRRPEELLDEWLENVDVAAPLHSFRGSVLAEAEAVIDGGLDDFVRVYEQMTHYLATHGEMLNENPHWTGMLARRRTVTSAAAMQAWWEDVLRYSRRDQLSFIPAMRTNHVRLRSVPLDTLGSAWHAWPRAEGRDLSRQGTGLREALRPPAGRIGELEQALDELAHTLAITVAQREEVISGLESALGEARESAQAIDEELTQAQHERDLLRSRVETAESQERMLRRLVERKSERLRKTRRKLAQLRREAQRKTRWQRAVRLLRGHNRSR